LVERFHRPAILLSIRDGIAKGSGRSVSAYDLVRALTDCAEHLTIYGGHRMAVGLTLDEANVGAFKEAIERHAADALSDTDLVPVFRVDAILRGEDVNADVAVALSSLGPFGCGNPRPRLAVLNAGIIQPECTRTGAHLKCQVEVDGVRARAIGFGMGSRAAELGQDSQRSIMGVQLRLNEWQGNVRPELVLDAVGPPLQTAAAQVECGPACPLASRDGASRDAGISPVEGESSGPRLKPLDHRDGGNSLVAAARVLATAESVVLLTCSASQAVTELQARLPFAEIGNGGTGCVSSACSTTAAGRLDGCRVVIAEWDVVASQPAIAASREHCIAIDPPYRAAHSNLLSELASRGVQVHLCYGEAERANTARLLRYLVHPRFAMVCVYRALCAGETGAKLHLAAAKLARSEAGVTLSEEALTRAADILKELGVDSPSGEGDKIEVRGVPLYASAEAEYEECHRLCRIL
jgi:single-stranded-DNA-specific exonuclease